MAGHAWAYRRRINFDFHIFMNLPITTASPVDLAGTLINEQFYFVGGYIQSALILSIQKVSGNSDYTAQDFWTAQSTNGAAVLNVFNTLAKVLASIYPELMTPEIANAGDNLIINPDGSITVKP